MKTIPYSIPPRESAATPQRIPRVIYQTFKSCSVTDPLYNNFLSYINLNPEYAYEFYDDERMAEYVCDFNCRGFNFTAKELKKAFDSLAVPAGKADLWRYLIMYENGGVYTDFDSQCLKPLYHSIDPLDDIVTCRIGWSHNYDNRDHIWLHLFPQWVLFYSPKCMIMKSIIELAVRCINSRTPVPDSGSCPNILERYTGTCVSNYVYRKTFNFRDHEQEFRLKNGIHRINLSGNRYQLHLQYYDANVFNHTILEKNFVDMNSYFNELNNNNTSHWLYQKSIFVD